MCTDQFDIKPQARCGPAPYYQNTNIHIESNKSRQLSTGEILLLNKLCRNFTFSELFKCRTVNKSPESVLSNYLYHHSSSNIPKRHMADLCYFRCLEKNKINLLSPQPWQDPTRAGLSTECYWPFGLNNFLLWCFVLYNCRLFSSIPGHY